MDKVLHFLREIRIHNDRDWFWANRDLYDAALEQFNSIAEKIINGISGFDSSTAGLGLKDCTYRIYRDTRFSLNKDPYKTHMGLYVCRGGKKSSYGGYYFHVEPRNADGGGGSFMSSGIYMPPANILRSVREEITENGKEILSAIGSANNFSLNTENKLKRNPVGFAPGSEWDEYLRLKDFYIERPLSEKWLTEGDVAAKAVKEFSKTHRFLEIINRAVGYALDAD